MPRIDFWFDFASTYSYLSAMRIEALAGAAGVEVRWMPFLLGPVFKAQGWDTSPFNIYRAKGQHMWRDMERQAARYGLPFKRPQEFPQFALSATRICVAARSEPWLADFCRGVFHFEYGEGESISGDEVIGELLCEIAPDASHWLTVARQDQTKSALRNRVAQAGTLDIFGAPTFICEDGELFWGDDRLEQAIAWTVQAVGTSPS